jgi:hypothetical protein
MSIVRDIVSETASSITARAEPKEQLGSGAWARLFDLCVSREFAPAGCAIHHMILLAPSGKSVA